MPRRASSFQDFDLASGALNLFLRRLAERMSMHGECNFQLAVTENFHFVSSRANHSNPQQNFWRHGLARRKRVQSLDIDDRERLRKRRRKPALRQTPVQRHLTTFKSWAAGIAATGLLPLVTCTRSLAHLRAHAASHAHLAVTRAARRLQVG